MNTQGSVTGRIAGDASGEITDIVTGTGIFFASHIEATVKLLRSAAIDFTVASEPCVFTPAAAAAQPLPPQPKGEGITRYAVLGVALSIALAAAYYYWPADKHKASEEAPPPQQTEQTMPPTRLEQP